MSTRRSIAALLVVASVALPFSLTHAQDVDVSTVEVPPPPSSPLGEAPSDRAVRTADPAAPSLSVPAPRDTAPPLRVGPRRTRTVHRANGDLVMGGAVLLAASYVANALGSALAVALMSLDWDATWIAADTAYVVGLIPLGGPAVFAAVSFDNHAEPFGVFAILDSAMQVTGAVMLLVGLLGEDVEVPDLTFLPSAPRTDVGASLAGTF